MAEEEIWKPVVGFEGYYEVSNHGHVRSLDRVVTYPDGHPHRFRGISLKYGWHTFGYPQVTLQKNGVRRRRCVHNVVMEAFVGPCPEGHEVAHGDGDPSNAKLSNLRYATCAENNADKAMHGTHQRGELIGTSRLTEEQVVEIRKRRAVGEDASLLAKAFGVSEASISHIVLGRSWKHAGGPLTRIRYG